MTATVLQRRYRPRGAAREVFARRESEVLISGPAGTGKSRACLEKLHAMMIASPGARGLIVRKTLASLGSTALATWRQHVVAEALGLGKLDFYGGSPQEPPQYRYPNGSRVIIGGMDKATKIMSSEYDVIYVQEATELTITDWESLTTRLRNGVISFQQLLADCNPAEPTHWLNLRCQAGQSVMLHGKHEDNPVLVNEDGTYTESGKAYLGKLDNLTGVRKQRLRFGRWVAAEGMIYESFDPAVNLIDKPLDPPHTWTRYWTVDFGYTNPFVLQCWAVDPDGRAIMYREIYQTRTLVEDHARNILDIVTKADGTTWKEPRPRAIICDHDAEDRATLERHLGMGTVPARKAVSDGLQAVEARWRVAGDGKPRLLIVRNSLVKRDEALVGAGIPSSTIEEIPGYVWNQDKDAPVKEGDHGCDAMRYLVAHLDLKARTRVRFM